MSSYVIPKRLDAVTAPEVENQLLHLIARENSEELVCDFSTAEYVSSAGLRVMLVITKRMKVSGGNLKLCGMSSSVYGIFKMAGLVSLLNIEAPVS